MASLSAFPANAVITGARLQGTNLQGADLGGRGFLPRPRRSARLLRRHGRNRCKRRQLHPYLPQVSLRLAESGSTGAVRLEEIELSRALGDLCEQPLDLFPVASVIRHAASSISSNGTTSCSTSAGWDSMSAADRRLPASDIAAST